jgi:ABC-2 type transport system ATP-binding protein
VTAVVEAHGLGKRYGSTWALADCSLTVPAGKVVGLVGPNGAGKSTLLQLAVGLLRPDHGSITVLGEQPGSSTKHLARIGFVAQDTPTYAGWAIRDHLWFGAQMNPSWDQALAEGRIAELGLDPRQKAGKLSGGQRAQLALTLAVAKRPELLLLDEPVAALDPLARREFLQGLTEVVADQQASVILSSHLISDLERVCDYLVVLVDSRVRVAGDIDELVASHYRLSGPRRERRALPGDLHVIGERHTDKQSTLVVRTDGQILDPSWHVEQLDLEDLVLAYMTRAVAQDRQPRLEVRS